MQEDFQFIFSGQLAERQISSIYKQRGYFSVALSLLGGLEP